MGPVCLINQGRFKEPAYVVSITLTASGSKGYSVDASETKHETGPTSHCTT